MMPAPKNTAAMRALREAVEYYFSDAFLFEPENAYFRARVSPRESEEENAELPIVSCSSLLHLTRICEALAALMKPHKLSSDFAITTKSAANAASEDEEYAQGELIADAVEGSDLVTATVMSEGEGCSNSHGHGDTSGSARPRYGIRRLVPLNPKEDPIHRTVVARPLPIGATLAEIHAFFATCGSECSVERIRALRQNANVATSAAAAAAAAAGSRVDEPGAAGSGSAATATAWRVNPFWCAYQVRFTTVAGAATAVAAFDVAHQKDEDHHKDSALVAAALETNTRSTSKKRARAHQDRSDGEDEDGDSGDDTSRAVRYPHFGPTLCALVKRFFPLRLYVSPLAVYEATQQEKRRLLEERQLRHNILKAQTALLQLRSGDASASCDEGQGSGAEGGKRCPHAKDVAAGGAESVTRYLRKDVTLVVDATPAGVAWNHVKTALGNLSTENENIKKCVQLVHIDERESNTHHHGGSNSARRAFVVCRTPEAARELLMVFSLCEGKVKQEVTKSVPTLRALTPEEQQYAQQQFPSWCQPKVHRKMQSNQKRPRSGGY